MMEGDQHMESAQPRRLAPRVESDPTILGGKPVIAGTRLSVEVILDQLACGDTTQDLMDAYPFLTAEDISAALKYAAHLSSLPASAQEHVVS